MTRKKNKKKCVSMKEVCSYDIQELQPRGVFPDGVPKLKPPFGGRKQWLVPETFCYIDRMGNLIIVTKGFLTDLASIPRVLRIVFGVNKRETLGAVLHDFGYRNQCRTVMNIFTSEYSILTKEDWDRILNDVMIMAETKPLREKAIYAGIKCFGWIGWYGNKRKQNKADDE